MTDDKLTPDLTPEEQQPENLTNETVEHENSAGDAQEDVFALFNNDDFINWYQILYFGVVNDTHAKEKAEMVVDAIPMHPAAINEISDWVDSVAQLASATLQHQITREIIKAGKKYGISPDNVSVPTRPGDTILTIPRTLLTSEAIFKIMREVSSSLESRAKLAPHDVSPDATNTKTETKTDSNSIESNVSSDTDINTDLTDDDMRRIIQDARAQLKRERYQTIKREIGTKKRDIFEGVRVFLDVANIPKKNAQEIGIKNIQDNLIHVPFLGYGAERNAAQFWSHVFRPLLEKIKDASNNLPANNPAMPMMLEVAPDELMLQGLTVAFLQMYQTLHLALSDTKKPSHHMFPTAYLSEDNIKNWAGITKRTLTALLDANDMVGDLARQNPELEDIFRRLIQIKMDFVSSNTELALAFLDSIGTMYNDDVLTERRMWKRALSMLEADYEMERMFDNGGYPLPDILSMRAFVSNITHTVAKIQHEVQSAEPQLGLSGEKYANSVMSGVAELAELIFDVGDAKNAALLIDGLLASLDGEWRQNLIAEILIRNTSSLSYQRDSNSDRARFWKVRRQQIKRIEPRKPIHKNDIFDYAIDMLKIQDPADVINMYRNAPRAFVETMGALYYTVIHSAPQNDEEREKIKTLTNLLQHILLELKTYAFENEDINAYPMYALITDEQFPSWVHHSIMKQNQEGDKFLPESGQVFFMNTDGFFSQALLRNVIDNGVHSLLTHSSRAVNAPSRLLGNLAQLRQAKTGETVIATTVFDSLGAEKTVWNMANQDEDNVEGWNVLEQAFAADLNTQLWNLEGKSSGLDGGDFDKGHGDGGVPDSPDTPNNPPSPSPTSSGGNSPGKISFSKTSDNPDVQQTTSDGSGSQPSPSDLIPLSEIDGDDFVNGLLGEMFAGVITPGDKKRSYDISDIIAQANVDVILDTLGAINLLAHKDGDATRLFNAVSPWVKSLSDIDFLAIWNKIEEIEGEDEQKRNITRFVRELKKMSHILSDLVGGIDTEDNEENEGEVVTDDVNINDTEADNKEGDNINKEQLIEALLGQLFDEFDMTRGVTSSKMQLLSQLLQLGLAFTHDIITPEAMLDDVAKTIENVQNKIASVILEKDDVDTCMYLQNAIQEFEMNSEDASNPRAESATGHPINKEAFSLAEKISGKLSQLITVINSHIMLDNS